MQLTLLHRFALMFRAVQCTTVQTVYCTNLRSTPLIRTKLLKQDFSVLKKVYYSFLYQNIEPNNKIIKQISKFCTDP